MIDKRVGSVAAAIDILVEATRREPTHNRAYHALAQIYLQAREFDRAEAILGAWEAARPGDPVLEETRNQVRATRRTGR